MTFENEKKQCLEKLDKSKKGSIDKAILPLINKINLSKDYYSTSSCSGRIVLLTRPDNNKKNQISWFLVSHDEVSLDQLKQALSNLPKDLLWLRQESCIIHICARTIEHAIRLINYFQEQGFKRTGLVSSSSRHIVEVMTTDSMDAPIAKDGKFIVSDSYLEILLKEANRKLQRTKEKIKGILFPFDE